ncbi:DEAD-domain-containing protein [Terfezia boudieri ATCC MYA-4762]|uniref:RNA helicase n=1 Tax=Terfezia boudieri ATCC MYA-4762 TaxID=1051890 RepID=A0A3N4LQD3_9PEZI|nr:DEAD-domain-containing protein [Terfezia boudieri ATCC MYA-4762]
MAKDKKPKPGKPTEFPVRPKKALKSNPADDFILTISDTEDNVPILDELEDEALIEAAQAQKDSESSEPESEPTKGKKRKAGAAKSKKAKKIKVSGTADGAESDEMDSEFEFQYGENEGVGGDFEWGLTEAPGLNGNKTAVDIDDIIRRRRHERGEDVDGPAGAGDNKKAKEDKRSLKNGDDEDDWDSSENEEAEDEEMGDFTIDPDDEDLAVDGFGGAADSADEEEAASGSDNDNEDKNSDDGTSVVVHPLDDASGDREAETARKNAFFAPESESIGSNSKLADETLSTASFQSMNLSRPILRGLTSVGFTTPTLIQAKTIPFALLGKDVVGGAVTGSGKTAAFIVPVLERLLYRPKKVPTSRVLVLCPTLAVKLAAYTDIRFSLAIGETELRARPDVIIATPGRFIDHMRNTAGVAVDTIEILVMDEADRMLEDGFADELNEIISHIPRSRQTMLFSATMTDSVDQLIRLSLNRPVRLMIDNKNSTVTTLIQEFVRIRPQREHLRLAMLVELCRNVYRTRTIIFFRSKQLAHRVRVLFGLLNLKAAELHGSLSQEQRVKSVELFRTSAVDFLLATDLASRGLDIKNVSTVINYESPQSHAIYLHRVGRTARAGRSGRACTLAGESDRKVVKLAVKAAKAQNAPIAARALDPSSIDKLGEELKLLETEIEEILKEEKEEKQLSQVEMQVRKGENMIKHEAEISSRPQRSWFQSQQDKKNAKDAMLAKLNGKELPEVGEKAGKKTLSGKGEQEVGRRVEGQKRGSGAKTLIKKVAAAKRIEWEGKKVDISYWKYEAWRWIWLYAYEWSRFRVICF